jgi:hypothetical protein
VHLIEVSIFEMMGLDSTHAIKPSCSRPFRSYMRRTILAYWVSGWHWSPGVCTFTVARSGRRANWVLARPLASRCRQRLHCDPEVNRANPISGSREMAVSEILDKFVWRRWAASFHTLFDTLTVSLPDTPGDSLRLLRHRSEFDLAALILPDPP